MVAKVSIYYPRQNANNITVAKFVDGDVEQVYTITGQADCNCPGQMHHKVQCRHNKIVALWRKQGKPGGQAYQINKAGEAEKTNGF